MILTVSDFIDGLSLWQAQCARVNQQHRQSDMHQKKRPEADDKIPVPRLVAEQVHSEQAAEAAAQRDNKKQRLFRDAPFPFFRQALVREHKNQRQKIHAEQITGIEIEHINSPFGGIV